MRIAIIGTGRVGSALYTGWSRSNYDVRLAGRDTSPSIDEAVAWADIIVLAVPFGAVADVAAQITPVSGKIVVDCTNPIAMGPDGLELTVGHTTSGAEQLQAALPEAHVIKTLNQVGAEVMADTHGFAHTPVQFVAGEDATAKDKVAALLSALGFEPLDAGGLSKARLLEPFALVWINQAVGRKKGRDWAFGAMPRANQ